MVILEACEGRDWEEAGAQHPAEAHGVVSHLGEHQESDHCPPPPEVDSTGASEAEGSGPQWWGPERDSSVSTGSHVLVNFAKGFLFSAFFVFQAPEKLQAPQTLDPFLPGGGGGGPDHPGREGKGEVGRRKLK